jgi:hypothetical protein
MILIIRLIIFVVSRPWRFNIFYLLSCPVVSTSDCDPECGIAMFQNVLTSSTVTPTDHLGIGKNRHELRQILCHNRPMNSRGGTWSLRPLRNSHSPCVRCMR